MNRVILLTAILVAITFNAYATNYYVDKTASGASDSNNGLASISGGVGGPFATIGKCASVMVAGDTCNVLAGMYDERVSQRASGSSASRVVYNASVGVKVRGFTLNGNYITVQGFEITASGMTSDSCCYRQVQIYGSNALIYNNTIHDTVQPCVRIGDGSTKADRAIIRGNTIHHCGNARSVGSEAAVQFYNTAESLAENNTVSYVGDYFTGGSGTAGRNVVRNNTMGPSIGDATYHIDGWQCGAGAQYVLFEGNRANSNTGTDNHLFLCQDTNDRNFIIRFNSEHQPAASSGGMECTLNGRTNVPGCYVYNNTFVGNNNASGNSMWYNISSTAHLARNNIFYNSQTISSDNPYIGPIDKDYDLRCCDAGALGETHGILADPLMTNVATGDFTLTTSSPAKNAGGPLTAVASGDAGAGTSLVLVDASPFQDGWAGTTPDCIAVSTTGNPACIASINYSTNTVTLTSAINRRPGDPVWLYKNSSGIQVLYGTAPAVGAFPFAPPSASPAVSISIQP